MQPSSTKEMLSRGKLSNLKGNVSDLKGDVSNLKGDVSNLHRRTQNSNRFYRKRETRRGVYLRLAQNPGKESEPRPTYACLVHISIVNELYRPLQWIVLYKALGTLWMEGCDICYIQSSHAVPRC